MSITFEERIYMWHVDMRVLLNRHVLHRDLVHHNCKSQRTQCDMLERECGAPWPVLLQERRHRRMKEVNKVASQST